MGKLGFISIIVIIAFGIIALAALVLTLLVIEPFEQGCAIVGVCIILGVILDSSIKSYIKTK